MAAELRHHRPPALREDLHHVVQRVLLLDDVLKVHERPPDLVSIHAVLELPAAVVAPLDVAVVGPVERE